MGRSLTMERQAAKDRRAFFVEITASESYLPPELRGYFGRVNIRGPIDALDADQLLRVLLFLGHGVDLDDKSHEKRERNQSRLGRMVRCPKCRAVRGEPCQTVAGKNPGRSVSYTHPDRQRAEIKVRKILDGLRAEREERKRAVAKRRAR